MTPEQTDLYYEALAECAKRYLAMAIMDNVANDRGYEDREYAETEATIVPFVKEFRDGVADRLPLMKLNRWLGYIQGVLIQRNMTTVQDERDYTRPYFRPIDFS